MDPELARRQALWAGMSKSDFGYNDTDYITTDDLKDQGRQYAQKDWEARHSPQVTPAEYKLARETNKSNPLEWALGMRDRGNNGGVLETVGQMLSIGQQVSSAVTEARVEGLKQADDASQVRGYWDAFKNQSASMMGTVLKTALMTPTGGLLRPDVAFSPDAYIDAWTNQHNYVHLAQKYGVYNNNPMGINEDVANYIGGFAADVALDPVSALTLGTTQWAKVGISAPVAAKAGLPALETLTHTRWGNTIWKLAAQDMAPQLVDHALTPQKFAEIADHAVANFDRFKKLHLDRVLKGNIWSKVKIGLAPAGETSKAALERLAQGKVQSLSGMGLKDMFQETSTFMTKEHGLYSTNKAQKFLASAPIIAKPMKWVFDTFDRGWQAPPEVNEAINLTKNKVEQQFKKAQLQDWAEFKKLGLDSVEDREIISTAIERRFAGALDRYAPHIEAGIKYYQDSMDQILTEAHTAGFKMGTVEDYVAHETNPMVRRSYDALAHHNAEELYKGGSSANKYIQQRMIASIADGEDIFGEGVFVKDSLEVLLKRRRAHINMIEKDRLFRFIADNHGTPMAIVHEQFNGMSKGLLAGLMRRVGYGVPQVLSIDQVYANKSGNLSKLGFKEGDLEHARELLAYLSRDNMDKLGVEGRAHGERLAVNEAAKMHYVFNDGKAATPVPSRFEFKHPALEGFDLGAGGRRREAAVARDFSVDTAMQMFNDASHDAWRALFKSDVAGTRADLTNVNGFLQGLNRFTQQHLDSPLVGFIPDIEKRVMDAWEHTLAADQGLVRVKGRITPDVGPMAVDAVRQKKLDTMRKAVQKTIASMGGNFEVIGTEPQIPETLVALATASRRAMGNITDTSVPHQHDLRYLEELYAKLGFTPNVKAQLEHITLGRAGAPEVQAQVDRLIETLDRFAYDSPMLRDGKIVETADRQIGKVTNRLGPDVRRTRSYKYDSRFVDDLVEFTFKFSRKHSGNVMPEINDIEEANVAVEGKLRAGSQVERELTAERMRKIAAGEVPGQRMGLHDVLPARADRTGFQGKNTEVGLAWLLADKDALKEAVEQIKYGKKAKSENGQVLADMLLDAGIEKNTFSKAKQDYFDKAKASALGKGYEDLAKAGNHDGAVKYLQEHMKTQASKDAVSALETYNKSMQSHSKWIETYTEADVLEQLHEKGLLPDFPTGEKPKDLFASSRIYRGLHIPKYDNEPQFTDYNRGTGELLNTPDQKSKRKLGRLIGDQMDPVETSADHYTDHYKPAGPWKPTVINDLIEEHAFNQFAAENPGHRLVGYTQELHSVNNAVDVLNLAFKYGTDQEKLIAKHLATTFKDTLGKVDVGVYNGIFVNGWSGYAAGLYHSSSDSIHLARFTSPSTAIHEAVHAMTLHVLDGAVEGNKESIKKLEDLFTAVKKSSGEADHYGLTNIHEFVAEAFSNKEFQDHLRSIPVERSSVSLWDKFVLAVSRMLGFKTTDSLGHAIALTNDVMKSGDATTKRLGLMDDVLPSSSTRVPGKVSENPSLEELRTANTDMTEHRRVLNASFKEHQPLWEQEDHYLKVATEATNKRDAAEKVMEARKLNFEAIKAQVDKLPSPTKAELDTVKMARKILRSANADLKPLIAAETKLKEAHRLFAKGGATHSREELVRLIGVADKEHGELLARMRTARKAGASTNGVTGGGAEFGVSTDAKTLADQLRLVRQQIPKASGTQLEDLINKKDDLVRRITSGGEPPPEQSGLNILDSTIEHKVYLSRGIAEVLEDLAAPEMPEGMSDAMLSMLHKWDKLTGLYKSNSLLPNAGYWGREFVGNAALMGLRTGTAFLDPTNGFEKMQNFTSAVLYALTKYSNYADDVGHTVAAKESALKKFGERVIVSKTGRKEKLSDLIESMMDRGIFHGQMSADMFDAMPVPTKFHRVIGAVNGAVAGGVAGYNGGGVLGETVAPLAGHPELSDDSRNRTANYGALMGAVMGGLLGAAGDKVRMGGIPVRGIHGAAGLLQSSWKPVIRYGEAATNMPFRVGLFMNEWMEHGSSYHAANEVYRHMNDMNSLSVVERRVMRRIFPYYSWMKNSLRHTGYQLIENPDRLATIHKGFRDWNDSQHVDPEDIPDNLSNSLALVLKNSITESATRDFNGVEIPERKVNAVISGLRLPEEDVAGLISGLYPGGGDADSKEFLKQVASRTNFPVAAIVQAIDNKDWYTGKQIDDQNPKDWRGAPTWLQDLVGYSPSVKGVKNESLVNPRLAWVMGKTPWSSLINMSKAIYEMPDQQKKGLDYWSMAHKLLGVNAYKHDPMTGRFFINKGRVDALSNLLQRVADVDSGSAP